MWSCVLIGVFYTFCYYSATVFFGRLGRLELGSKTAVTIDVADRGTNPVRYRVIFKRG